MKGEIGSWAVVKSAGSKEASVVNMEYTWLGLVIQVGAHSHCHSYTLHHGNVKLFQIPNLGWSLFLLR